MKPCDILVDMYMHTKHDGSMKNLQFFLKPDYRLMTNFAKYHYCGHIQLDSLLKIAAAQLRILEW